MKKISLEEFMTEQTSFLMDFASAWREHHLDKPTTFPIVLSELSWLSQYLAFIARRTDAKNKVEEKENEEALNKLSANTDVH